MSAVTTSTETVSPWTMGRNVSVSSLFPTPVVQVVSGGGIAAG